MTTTAARPIIGVQLAALTEYAAFVENPGGADRRSDAQALEIEKGIVLECIQTRAGSGEVRRAFFTEQEITPQDLIAANKKGLFPSSFVVDDILRRAAQHLNSQFTNHGVRMGDVLVQAAYYSVEGEGDTSAVAAFLRAVEASDEDVAVFGGEFWESDSEKDVASFDGRESDPTIDPDERLEAIDQASERVSQHMKAYEDASTTLKGALVFANDVIVSQLEDGQHEGMNDLFLHGVCTPGQIELLVKAVNDDDLPAAPVYRVIKTVQHWNHAAIAEQVVEMLSRSPSV
jgi:hypothetical protein